MNARLASALVCMLTLFAAGLATGVQAYYLVGAALLMLILISAAAALWALFSVRVEIRGLKPRVIRGESLMTIFTLRHTCLMPVNCVRLKLNVPSALGAAQEISVVTPPYKEKTFRYMIRCPHRGTYDVGVTAYRARDMFGLFTFTRKAKEKLVRVDVAPRVLRAEPMPLKVSDMGPITVSRATEDMSSPSDVRTWRDGDVLKKVHWKLTMRRRELMVKVFEESSRPDTLIIPDLTEIAALTDQALTIEDGVCEACLSMAKAQLEGGYPVRTPLMCKRPSELSGQFPQDYANFTDALMRVKFDSPYAFEQVLTLMMQRVERTGGAVIITPKLTSRIADACQRLQRFGVRTKLIWVTDNERDESLELLERLKMESVLVERLNPWRDGEGA